MLQIREKVQAVADRTLSGPLCLLCVWAGGRFEINCRKKAGRDVLSREEDVVSRNSRVTGKLPRVWSANELV